MKMRKPEEKIGNPIIVALDKMDQKRAFGIVDKIIEAGLFNHGVWGVKLEEPSLNQKSAIWKLIEKGIQVRISEPELDEDSILERLLGNRGIQVEIEGSSFKKALIQKLLREGISAKIEELSLNHNAVIWQIRKRGIRVFSDPRLYVPMPDQMPRQIAYYTPADFISICASMPDESIREAVNNAPMSRIAALLVPSSFDDATCQSKHGKDIEGTTYEFAVHGKSCGIQAFICPPRELEILSRYREFHNMRWIAVAVRPEGYQGESGHRETITPRKALEAGADHLVIGGPITETKNEVQAIKEILEEIKDFLR